MGEDDCLKSAHWRSDARWGAWARSCCTALLRRKEGVQGAALDAEGLNVNSDEARAAAERGRWCWKARGTRLQGV